MPPQTEYGLEAGRPSRSKRPVPERLGRSSGSPRTMGRLSNAERGPVRVAIGSGPEGPAGPWPSNPNPAGVRVAGPPTEPVGVLKRVATLGGLPVAVTVLALELVLGAWMAYGFSQDTPDWTGVVLAAVLALAGPVSALVCYRGTEGIDRVARLCRAEAVGILVGLPSLVLLVLWLGAITLI
jgi:hypothetical protein